MDKVVFGQIVDGLKQIRDLPTQTNFPDRIAGIMDQIPDNGLMKVRTKVAKILVAFYIKKVHAKKTLVFGTSEYDEYDKKLRIWEAVIQGCLKELKLEKLDGLGGAEVSKLQRMLATYFPYIGTTGNN